MTPLGHAATAYAAGRAIPRGVPIAAVIGGIAPDVDFVLLPFSFFNEIHRVATHNVFFIVVVASVAAGVFHRDRFLVFLCALMGGALHLFIDSILDNNPTNGIGVALFWPMEGTMFSPFNLAGVEEVAPAWDGVSSLARIPWRALAIEVPFYLLAGVLFVVRRRAGASTMSPISSTDKA
jgi:membrane-bound metal-dependent hydrolase YbcI (DUF457 family)